MTNGNSIVDPEHWTSYKDDKVEDGGVLLRLL